MKKNKNVGFVNKLAKVVCLFCLILFMSAANKLFASAWTKEKGELYYSLEALIESDSSNALLGGSDNSYYRNISYKLYFEYGLVEDFTIGGYLKKYDYHSRGIGEFGDVAKDNLNNDYYGNIFFLQNIYSDDFNSFALQYLYYFPLKYNTVSKIVNTVDTKNALGVSVLYGFSDYTKVFDENFKYFVNLSVDYKAITKIKYDEAVFNITAGLNFNDSTTINLHYEYQYYFKSNIFNENDFTKYNASNANKVEIGFTTKFFDEVSTKLAFYRNFSKTNSNGITFSFIFNYL